MEKLNINDPEVRRGALQGYLSIFSMYMEVVLTNQPGWRKDLTDKELSLIATVGAKYAPNVDGDQIGVLDDVLFATDQYRNMLKTHRDAMQRVLKAEEN